MNFSSLKVLSEVSRDIAQVFFASAVVTQIFNVEGVRNWFTLGSGATLAFIFWWSAVRIGEKGKI